MGQQKRLSGPVLVLKLQHLKLPVSTLLQKLLSLRKKWRMVKQLEKKGVWSSTRATSQM